MKNLCKRCGKVKSDKDFYKCKRYKSGLFYYCKLCCGELSKLSMRRMRATPEGLEKTNMASKRWWIKNKHYRGKYEKKRKKVDNRFKIRCNFSCLIRSKLKKRLLNKNYNSCFEFLPYTIKDLMEHLENNFEEGMSWDNYGLWHIDHKKPDSWFDYKSIEDEEFRKCWSLNNLQPKWALENMKKSDKFED